MEYAELEQVFSMLGIKKELLAGGLFLLPYTQASHAAFCREIKRERDCGL